MTAQAQLFVKNPGKQSHLLDLSVEKAAKISAKGVGSLVLKNTDNDFSPENITLLRAGADLNVILEGDQKPSLIITDYFDMVTPPALTGVAEDYLLYVYQPSRLDFVDDTTGYSFPADNMEPALLAGKAIGDGNLIYSTAPKAEESNGSVYESLPWFLGIVGGVAAVSGIGLAIRNHHRHHHHRAESGSQHDEEATTSGSTHPVASNQTQPDSSITPHVAPLIASAPMNQDEQLTVSHLASNSLSGLNVNSISADSSSLPPPLAHLDIDSKVILPDNALDGHGGSALTTLLVNGADLVLDLSRLSHSAQGDGITNLTNDENQLTVGFNDVLKMGEEHLFTHADDYRKQMMIQGGDGDTLNSESDGEKWTAGANQDVAGHIYFTHLAENNFELLVDAHLSQVNTV